MGRNKEKGSRGERIVKDKFLAAGFQEASRNYADSVEGKGIDVTAGKFNIQVKNWKKSVPTSYWLKIADEPGRINLLATNNTSKRGEPWLVTLSLDDFLSLITGEDNG